MNKAVERWRIFTFKSVLIIFTVFTLTGLLACSSAPAQVSTVTSLAQASSTPAVALQTDFVTAVAKDMPSIVKIEVQYGPQGIPGTPTATGGAGTGWVVEKGIIVTNAHVVANAQTIAVVLADGTQLAPIAVKSDSIKDLAVLKISDQYLSPLAIGDSAKLQQGQPVAAIGNALDLGIRVTSGVVSQLNITVNSPNVQYSGLIETDATINPGNSGGVLITASGDVVGITNAGLQDPTLDPESFGYAISINEAMPVINSLISQLP